MKKQFLFLLILCLLFSAAAYAQSQDQYFNANGIKIRYTVMGKGEPVLLIHGWSSYSEQNWEAVMKDLSLDHLVIAMDCRGHGKSDKPHDAGAYGMEMVKDAVRLLDHLQIKQAHIVGYSMGGMIVTKFLITYPERCLTATLGGSGGVRQDFNFKMLEPLADNLAKGMAVGDASVAALPANFPKPSKELIEITNKRTAGNDSQTLGAAIQGFKELIVTDEQLKTNKVPTLLIYGSKDAVGQITPLKDHMPGVEVKVVEGADHLSAPNSPEFVKGLREFLGRHATSNQGK